MYDDILVPTDGGEQMEEVIDQAVAIAADRGATLHGISVIDKGVFLTLDEHLKDAVEEELTTEAQEAVDELSAAADDADLESEAVVRRGRPGEEIRAYADEVGADLIVMGTRGADSHERRMLGSVSQDVVTESTLPVLVIPLEDD
ncbi:UspA domain protein [Natronomonas pharaonis DSM 2160]|uniref:UspA domain protein n=1 Tax=Natronomonas pharaonis (strain ATCC 35678 / DSM 2160 / CIP 103997 / JCM 8858 / NBRC 14720 / NCIMB 2260 / Gabara) TaxID=348780 RepID=A0A1U7ETB4_NATPD|nr:universal stress protein [Natronomonas pharaonis]CAI48119.1 UspA domain protein [Natronomonas pharaonis DSM 2160]